MNRRGFIGSIIATAAAQAVRAEAPSQVVPRDTLLHEYSNDVWLWHASTREWSQPMLPAYPTNGGGKTFGWAGADTTPQGKVFDSQVWRLEWSAAIGAFLCVPDRNKPTEAFALVPPDWQDPRKGRQ